MIRFLMLLSFLFLLNFSWPVIEKQFANNEYLRVVDEIQTELTTLKENPEVLATINTLYDEFQQILEQLDLDLEPLTGSKQQKEEQKQLAKPELRTPSEQSFSIYNVELGNAKDDIEHNLGAPKRSSINEYGIEWHTYHENYQHFFMIAYNEKNKVAGLYTNQDLITSTKGIKLGSTKETVRTQLGEPITKILKGLVYYQFQENSDYDLFLIDGSYVTVFYDKHEDNTVTAIQLISEELEQNKKDFYVQESQPLKEGFEYQLFDLTNATRVNHNLNILTWDDLVKETARKHSSDMATKNYFDHTNLEGLSPFDRMEEDQVVFNLAGENLATGQFSSIFAHEGLMNSLGHRENILREDFDYLGVGVAFNNESQPYYTENFYSK